LLIAAGTNLRTVSSRLGHSQASTTANIYAHAIQSADAAAADTIGDILSPAKKQA
jgi:integrase